MINLPERRDKQLLIDELEAAGARVDGTTVRCPFHNDGRPSGSIYLGGDGLWRYRCHDSACAFQGDVYDVRAKRTGKSVRDVLPSKHTLPPTGNIEPRAQSEKRVYPTLAAMTETLSNLEERYEYFNSTDQLVYVVFRKRDESGAKKYLQAHRVETGGYAFGRPEGLLPLYNLTMARGAERIVVVEGERCVNTLTKYGIRAVSAPCGAGQANCADWSPLAGKQVVIWPDNDDPGQRHAKQVREILEKLIPPPTEISIIDITELDLPPKGDVVDYVAARSDLLRDQIVEQLECTLAAAEQTGYSQDVAAVLEEIISGKRSAIEWPWRMVTSGTKALLPGTVTILCGDPGFGKSLFLLQAITYWHDLGIPAAVYELEESVDYHLFRALAQHSNNSNFLDDAWVRANKTISRELVKKNRAWLNSLGKTIYANPDKEITLPEIADWVDERAAAGCRIIAVDPITIAAKSEMSWRDDLAFMTRVKLAAQKYCCSVILVAHPRIGKRFGHLDDIAGGAAYPRLAQTVLILESADPHTAQVQREGSEDIDLVDGVNRFLRLAKCRNGRGQGIKIAFRFEGGSLRFIEHGAMACKHHEPATK